MRRPGWILWVGLAICTLFGAEDVEAARYWVQLPRAASLRAEDPQMPYAPAPDARALARRALKGRPDRVAVVERGPEPESLQLLRNSGARILFVSRWLAAASVEAAEPERRELERLFGASRIRPVRALVGTRDLDHATPIPFDRSRRGFDALDYGPSARQLQQLQVDQLHAEGFSGHGVRILVLDTGFRSEIPAFAHMNIVGEWDFVHDDPETGNEATDPPSQDRHGTGVLGALGGWAPGELVGGAYAAEFLLAKTEWVETETRVEEDDFIAALEWGEALGADLMSASLGYRTFYDEPDTFSYTIDDLDGDTAAVTRAVDDLVALGVVAISAMGNDGPDPQSLLAPSDADSLLAIGAVDSLGVTTNFSGRGPTADGRIKPDVMAQGKKTVWSEPDGTYAAQSGTSLATPVAAGAVALILEAHPEWGPGQVIDAVRGTATEAGAPDSNHGHGVVQAHDAVWDLAPPVVPLPFALVEPADSAFVASAPVVFRWRRPRDAQTPGALTYQLEFAPTGSFDEVLSRHAAADTVRTLAHLPDGEVWWRVVARDPEGNERASRARRVTLAAGTGTPEASAVSWAGWVAAGPNPASTSVVMRLTLQRPASVTCAIYDVAGRRVRGLDPAGSLPAGERAIVWDGTDEAGNQVSSGVYLLRAVVRDAREGRIVLTSRRTLLR